MIGDDIAAALPELRQQAESLMTTACVVERKSGTEFDPETNQDVTTWESVYEGPCRLAQPTVQSVIVAGGQEVTTQPYAGMLPWGTVGVLVGDRLSITAAEDPGQVGRVFMVTSVRAATQSVGRRFVAIEDLG